MRKKLLPFLLSGTILAAEISTALPASAVYMTNKDFILPDDCVEYTGELSFAPELSTVYRRDGEVNGIVYTSFIILSNFHFNYTVFQTTDPAAFETIYEKYNAKLDFDDFSNKTDSEGTTTYYMSDMYDENGERSKNSGDFSSKQDLIWQMTQELKEAGVLLRSDYQFCKADLCKYDYEQLIILDNLPLADKDIILKKIEQYDNETTLEITESDDTFKCQVEAFESFDDATAFSHEIKETYDGATAAVMLSSILSNETSTQSKSIDLLTAQRQGDPGNDTKVTPDDAYQTLCYFAKTSVNADAAFTDNSDETKEAAAFAAADVNGDGVVDADDAYLILRYYAAESVGGTPSWD